MRDPRSNRLHSPHPVAAVSLLFTFLLIACGGGGDDGTGPPDPPGDPQGVTLNGSVTHGGAGVGSVTVLLRDGPGQNREATTPNGGTFSFSDVEPGNWQLEVTPPPYFEMAPGQSAVRAVQVSATTPEVGVTLAPVDDSGIEEIGLGETSFLPATVTVAPGTRVRWINQMAMVHTITPNNHSEWSAGNVESNGQVFEAVLNNPGTFSYFCVPHQSLGMTGVLTVQP